MITEEHLKKASQTKKDKLKEFIELNYDLFKASRYDVEFGSKRTFSEIAKFLNNNKIKTPHQNKWYAETVKRMLHMMGID